MTSNNNQKPIFWLYFAKKAFEKAVENLQIFCCKMGKEETYNYCNQEMKDKVGGPSSTYLLDHILDVSLRRLDAKEKMKTETI